MVENVLNKIKNLFSNKDKKKELQKKRHDILVEAMDKPVVQQSQEVALVQEHSLEKKDVVYPQVSEKDVVVVNHSTPTIKKDYKSIYKKHIQNLSDKKEDRSLYSSEDYSVPQPIRKKQTETENIPKEEPEEQVKQEPTEGNNQQDQQEQPTSLDNHQSSTKTEESVSQEPSQKEDVSEPSKDSEFLSKKEEQDHKLKKFFTTDKSSQKHLGLNRYKNTTESYEFLTKKPSKSKNKPNFNKVDY